MKEAILYKKLKNDSVQCLACQNKCVIPEGKWGICGVRKNIKGKLYLAPFGKAIAVNIDPIEKKPLFHFLPGEKAFSLGTLGCNFSCLFCQNWDISQPPRTQSIRDKIEKSNYWGADWPPKKVVSYCRENKIPIIAYTYNEPTVWTEYALAIMKLAHQHKIKNVWVSNGYMTEETLELIHPYLDAINVDLKSFQDKFYREITGGRVEPVKENIKRIWQMQIWEEVTTLVIPGLNDSDKELNQIAQFIAGISKDIPWHITAFYPAYKMQDRPPTPKETLIRAYNIGKKNGLRYVYLGNIPDTKYQTTYCPHCGEPLIERYGMGVLKNKLQNGRCPHCHTKIAGIFS